MVIAQVKITAKRQITLPIRVMHKLGLHVGDVVVFEEKEGHVVIRSKTKK